MYEEEDHEEHVAIRAERAQVRIVDLAVLRPDFDCVNVSTDRGRTVAESKAHETAPVAADVDRPWRM